jgi:pimeloyl-ACP methyl ester carboxylesterase
MVNKLIYVHGLGSSPTTFKASFLRERFPELITPQFSGILDSDLALIHTIIGDTQGWILIGSSYGGLVAAIYTLLHPSSIKKLVLLAPTLKSEIYRHLEINHASYPIAVPTIVYHGIRDGLPIPPMESRARNLFADIQYNIVDDDHGLKATMQRVDWKVVLE